MASAAAIVVAYRAFDSFLIASRQIQSNAT